MDQRKDILMNNYLGNPDLFADFFNVILFAGREVLHPEELTYISADHKEMVGENDETAVPVIRYRDNIKQGGIVDKLALFALESETKVDYTMVSRMLLYDAAAYRQQVRAKQRYNKLRGGFQNRHEFFSQWKKEDALLPVITITLYYTGDDLWDGKQTLADLVHLEDYPQEFQKVFQNYHLNLVDAQNIPHPERFRTELRAFFTLLGTRGDPRKLKGLLKQKDLDLRLSHEGARLIGALWKNEKNPIFLDILETFIEKDSKGGKTDMSSVIDRLCDMVREEGREEGVSAGETRFAKLSLLLLERNRHDDLRRAAVDCKYRESLYKAFQL